MDLVINILRGLAMSKSQRHFLEGLLVTILVTRGKITFRNLSRYSAVCERTYSRHFAKSMDWVGFNRQVIDATFGPDSPRIVAFDPTFIPKAGKHTFGRSSFWNGLKSRSEKGLEISAVAVVDLTRNQGLTLSVQQTRPITETEAQADISLIDRYVDHLRAVRPHLRANEAYICADGGLANTKFLNGVCAMD